MSQNRLLLLRSTVLIRITALWSCSAKFHVWKLDLGLVSFKISNVGNHLPLPFLMWEKVTQDSANHALSKQHVLDDSNIVNAGRGELREEIPKC